MPALDLSVVARDQIYQLAKRENWAHREPGVILVFCIVFIVAVGLCSLFIHKKIKARRAARGH